MDSFKAPETNSKSQEILCVVRDHTSRRRAFARSGRLTTVLFLTLLSPISSRSADTHQHCAEAQQLWVSPGLLSKISSERIEESLTDFARSVKEPNGKPDSLHQQLSAISIRKEAAWLKMFMADEDVPDSAPFMVPAELKLDHLAVPELQFGKPTIEKLGADAGGPNRYRVRVPLDQLEFTMNLALDCQTPECQGKRLVGLEGLRASLDRTLAPDALPPFVEYEVNLAPGKTLADVIQVIPGSARFHLPVDAMSIGLKATPGNEAKVGVLDAALESAEVQGLGRAISGVTTQAEFQRLLHSAELRALEQKYPGLVSHLEGYLQTNCRQWVTSAEALERAKLKFFHELQMKLALEIWKPQVANRSSLEALTFMRTVGLLAGKNDRDARARTSLPGVIPIMNETLGPILAERISGAIRNSKLGESLTVDIPVKTPAEIMGAKPRNEAKAKPLAASVSPYELQDWAPARDKVGGLVASARRCGESGGAPSTAWLEPEMAAKLSRSSSAALGVTVSELNEYLGQSFSESSQNTIEYRNKDANDELERARKQARKEGKPEPQGKLIQPDRNIRLEFREAPRLAVEKNPETGKQEMFLNFNLRESQGGIVGTVLGGTALRSKVKVVLDPKDGKIKLDASQTHQRFDDRSALTVLNTLFQSVNGLMLVKLAALKGKVIPSLNQSLQFSSQFGEWKVNTLQPSSDGSRIILGANQTK